MAADRGLDSWILSRRGAKNHVDPWVPYAFLAEPERTAEGELAVTATVFLTNRECPFRCLMCDLWRNTTDETVPAGAIGAQVEYALARLPPATQIKLYNSGNFFDPRAIPPQEHAPLAAALAGFSRVIVENHPRLCGEACLRFRDHLAGRFEVALGLETVDPQALERLNKQMTVADFDAAIGRLHAADIDTRAFILLRAPGQSEAEGREWALRSLEHAFALGVGCCALIPTRGGNGALDQLALEGQFAPPLGSSLERVLDEALPGAGGRVFVDLWDAARLFPCDLCAQRRLARLARMNLTQQVEDPVRCSYCGAEGVDD